MASRHIERERAIEFGKAFEHLMLMELLAYRTYRERQLPIRYWRTKTGIECDFVIDHEGEIAIEVKGAPRIRDEDLKGLRAFMGEHEPQAAFLVCNDKFPRRTSDGISILPWQDFLENLWMDNVIR